MLTPREKIPSTEKIPLRLVRTTLRINKRLARLKSIKQAKKLLMLTHKNSEALKKYLKLTEKTDLKNLRRR